MELSSYVFIFLFLPFSLLQSFIISDKYRKWFLVFLSIGFVATFSLEKMLILLIATIINYFLIKNTYNKKKFLIIGVIFNILFLGFYKYTDFILININSIFKTNIAVINLIAPIGLSFIVFQNISCLVDVYKGDKFGKLEDFLLYTFYFPKVINGPIVKFSNFMNELNSLNKTNIDNIFSGIVRFSYGMAKVLILSSILGNYWRTIYSIALSSGVVVTVAWFGIICYSLYLYLNFSGFIDISIGISKMLNITLPENFNYPYLSTSVTEFWRRWHMSLSNWFKEYIYIPLGGNRKGNVYLNIMIVFLLTGIWHGASWNFIVWGIYHGIFNIIDKLIKKCNFYDKIPLACKVIMVNIIVIFGWVLFASNGIKASLVYYKNMFGLVTPKLIQYNFSYYLSNYNLFFLGLSILISFGTYNYLIKKLDNYKKNIVEGILALLLLVISIIFLVNNSYVPSIYANF